MKDKLITIKPFLNFQLAGIVHSNTVKTLPLYYQITYNRKNTQLKSIFNIYLVDIEDCSKEEESQIIFESDTLKRLIRYESIKNKEEFSLMGIKSKYELYAKPLDVIMQDYLKKRLQKAMSLTGSEFQKILKFDGFDANFLLLLKASKQLIDNLGKYIDEDFKSYIDSYKAFAKSLQNRSLKFEYISLLDWLDESCMIDLKRNLLEYYKEDATQVNKTMSILNEIIEDRIKFL